MSSPGSIGPARPLTDRYSVASTSQPGRAVNEQAPLSRHPQLAVPEGLAVRSPPRPAASGSAPRLARLNALSRADAQSIASGLRPSATGASAAPQDLPRTQQPLLSKARIAGFSAVESVVGLVDKTPPKLAGKTPVHALFCEPFAKGPDGVIRRFPPGDLSPGYMAQIEKGAIKDAPLNLIQVRHAGFEVSPDGQQVSYRVGGEEVAAERIGPYETYALGNGRVMVLNSTFKDCTSACEAMMLHDQDLIDPSRDKAKQVRTGEGMATMEQIALHLEATTPGRTIQVQHKINFGSLGLKNTEAQTWRDLGSKIKEHGPCMLDKGDHVVMLDGVREQGGKFYLTIRDPFHGTYAEVRAGKELFGSDSKITIQALFLSTPEAFKYGKPARPSPA